MNNRNILERAIANGQPMTEPQRRAMWAKRAHPQPTNPQLVQLRPGGSMSLRPTGPQRDIVTRPVSLQPQPASANIPPEQNIATSRGSLSLPSLREWQIGLVRAFVGRQPPGQHLQPPRFFQPGLQPPGRIGVPIVRPIIPKPRPVVGRTHVFNRFAAAFAFLSRHGDIR
jgi:hypothetical protein